MKQILVEDCTGNPIMHTFPWSYLSEHAHRKETCGAVIIHGRYYTLHSPHVRFLFNFRYSFYARGNGAVDNERKIEKRVNVRVTRDASLRHARAARTYLQSRIRSTCTDRFVFISRPYARASSFYPRRRRRGSKAPRRAAPRRKAFPRKAFSRFSSLRLDFTPPRGFIMQSRISVDLAEF